jgi:DNA (cytosine-5)-methyltransferase 1
MAICHTFTLRKIFRYNKLKKETILTKPIKKQNFFNFNKIKNKTAKYKIIDLFAGVGGIRLGFENAFKSNASFVFSSEIDKYAQITYCANFGETPHGDITKISPDEISEFDILIG